MDPARIAELLHPFLQAGLRRAEQTCHSEPQSGKESAVLSTALLQNISTYIDILLRWNAHINLTAVREPDQIVTRHFGESLFAAGHLFPDRRADACERGVDDRSESGREVDDATNSNGDLKVNRRRAALQGREPAPGDTGALAPVTLADLGSGAGFPGIPIKLWAPNLSLTLIESNQKKATFLREIARALTLTDINIKTARAETLPSHSFDVITLRAVERFETILPIAAQLVRPAGRLVLLIGSAQATLARQSLPSLLWSDPIPIPNSRVRTLLVAQVPVPAGT